MAMQEGRCLGVLLMHACIMHKGSGCGCTRGEGETRRGDEGRESSSREMKCPLLPLQGGSRMRAAAKGGRAEGGRR